MSNVIEQLLNAMKTLDLGLTENPVCLSITFSTQDYSAMRSRVCAEVAGGDRVNRFEGVVIRHDALLAPGFLVEEYRTHCIVITPTGERMRLPGRNFLKFPVALP